MKALKILLAKLMYMQCMFPCEGGMHLLAGFSSIGYLRGKVDLENCRLSLMPLLLVV